jgi:putative aldouronate transport system substrate-binding protein
MKNVKVISYLAALIMTINIFLTGCGGSKGLDVFKNEQEKIKLNQSLEEHYDLTIGYWDIQNGFWSNEEDDFLKEIQKDFNITIKPVQVTWSNYKEKYQIMAASGQLPDISANAIVNTGIYNDWISQGIIRAIPKDLGNYPNVSKIMELPDVKALKIDDKYFMIPRISFEDRNLFASTCALLVRKDWMDKLGIKDPQNFDEFTAMLKAFVKDDPDENDKNDTVGLALNTRDALGKWIILNIYPQFNTYTWVKDGDKFVPSCAAKDFPKVLVKLRKLYTEGVLDKNFAVQNAGEGTEKFAQGKAGALEYVSAPSGLLVVQNLWDKYNPDKKFTDNVKLLHVFPAEDGNLYHNTSTVFWSESYFSSNVSDKKMDRILKLYDYLLSNEGKTSIRFGLEEKDYIKEGNSIKVTRPKDEKTGRAVAISNLYPSIPAVFGGLASWGGAYEEFEVNEINKANYPADILKMANDEINWNLNNTKPMPRPYDILTMFTPAKAKFDSINIMNDVTRVIIGKEDPLVMWDRILKEYEAKGLLEAIEEVNAKARELGIK